MKNKIKITALFVFAVMLLFSFQSCDKYEDNEGISLASRTARVSNVWKVDNYNVNGVDYTSLVSGYSETFTKEGAFSFQWGIIGGTGTWAFQNNDEEILITGVNNLTTKTLFIQKLEETQFWYYYMEGSEKREFHMVQQ